ncbi:MAG TPA: cupin domain-containing protein [Mycobacteriales bacterium]|nr:cupin domain-containing protein [Mycobacteriales bacterium]
MIRQSDLPWSSIAHELVGDDHGGIGLCVIFVDAEPGRGPGLHTHPYDEVLIIQEGRATATVGDETVEVGAGDIVLIPAGEPHAFTNTGESNLRQIDIHASPRFSTEWLVD